MTLCAALIKRTIFSFSSMVIIPLIVLQIVLAGLFCGQVDFSTLTVISKLDGLFPFASIRLADIADRVQSFLHSTHRSCLNFPCRRFLFFILPIYCYPCGFLKTGTFCFPDTSGDLLRFCCLPRPAGRMRPPWYFILPPG
ncbi:MAG: hypothetical protein R2861_02525 [Desulfobacterales bacterium]